MSVTEQSIESDPLAYEAARFITLSMRVMSSAEFFVKLQGWRSWRTRVPGVLQTKALQAGEDLMAAMFELQQVATTLRVVGDESIVEAVDELMEAMLPTTVLVEQRVQKKERWEDAINTYVTVRSRVEATIRSELMRRRAPSTTFSTGAAEADQLVARSAALEARAAELQPGAHDKESLDRLVLDYHGWLADALAWLPDDLRGRFRGEYEGSWATNKIKKFLTSPLAPQPLYDPDRPNPLTPTPWLYPFESCFAQPINGQRQIIIEASRRPHASTPSPAAVVTLGDLWSRFPNAVGGLKKRHGDDRPFEIHSEYDIQYLAGFLLRAYFPNVRAEEVSPSSAGASSRIDFLLSDDEVFIELKFTSTRLKDKLLGEQIATDLERYRQHPKGKVLVFLVYDPDRQLEAPESFIRDFTRPTADPPIFLFLCH